MRTLIKQYAELARISNLPTCWTNVLTGSVIGSIAASSSLAILPVVFLSVIISLFYMAGMALNDLVDLKIDQQQGPSRPIASGRISPRAALVFIILLFAIAMSLLLICFPHCIYLGLLLAAMIILYDITHKRFSFSVAFMAACRALIYIVSAYAVFGVGTKEFRADIAIASAVLALYISFVTLIARSENKQQIDKRRWLSVAIMLLVPAPFAISLPTTIYPCIVAVILLIILSRAAIFAFSDPPLPVYAFWTVCSWRYWPALCRRPQPVCVLSLQR
ncbi:MAG: UbiA family prenyltransferase [Planctomycetota bacterium]|jgi:4-hydroxybenzoate polyprenyltransferase